MVALSHETLLIRELTEHAERTCGVGDMKRVLGELWTS